ncbi:hypothetical protein TNCT_313651 [Trichonephila clavata]|uniref:Uncharacterized protein n=1 Tax=Trichonephila clavata TaxID=2740835 RepID=A0A8X6FPM9_TRICU|nr:hypothetical protein TNCT_313651 [Trichonephila clavata]
MGAPKEEQCGMVRVLTDKDVFQKEISRHMTAAYSVHCISLATVKRFSKRLSEGRESCIDHPRPDQNHLTITPTQLYRLTN